jgi:tetratricopeptide (TPR) repeat protein
MGQFAMAEQPVIHVNLGTFYAVKGRGSEAEAAFERALSMDSTLTPAWANLADLYRAVGSEAAATTVLETGLRLAAEPAPLYHARGLGLIRQGRLDEAMEDLQRAVDLAPNVARYAYVYAVGALEVRGSAAARDVLALALQNNPGDLELLSFSVTLARGEGRLEDARELARRLLEMDPGDPDAQRLALELGVAG